MGVVPALAVMCTALLARVQVFDLPPNVLEQVILVTAVLAQEAALLFLTLGVVRSSGQSHRILGLVRHWAWQDIGWGLVLGIVFLIINFVGESVSLNIFRLFMDGEVVSEILKQENAVIAGLFSREQPLWLRAVMGILVTCIAPVVEETFFRGYAYGVFKAHWGKLQALLASSFLFALVHMYVVHFPSIFLLGILLALVYEWRGNLVSPIVAHGMMNFMVAVVLYLT